MRTFTRRCLLSLAVALLLSACGTAELKSPCPQFGKRCQQHALPGAIPAPIDVMMMEAHSND